MWNHCGRGLENTLSIAPHSTPTKGNTQTKENMKAEAYGNCNLCLYGGYVTFQRRIWKYFIADLQEHPQYFYKTGLKKERNVPQEGSSWISGLS